jgi:uncharacterized protein (UPF0276 family)
MKNNKTIFGVGLRHKHFPYYDSGEDINVDFFEILTENYLNTRGRPFEVMLKLRERFPMAMHGVSLSIASNEDIDFKYLDKVLSLTKIIDPIVISDHLCFTGLKDKNLHNLLPFAYTKENLEIISVKINRVQDFMQRQYVFENLSAYFTLKNSEMTEAEFLNELCNQTGAGILFDINNLYVNSINQKFSTQEYIKALNPNHVKQFHLAGFTDFGDYLFDTHAEPIHGPVWDLYKDIIGKIKNVPVLIEWDENIPEYKILEAEMMKAKAIYLEVNNE